MKKITLCIFLISGIYLSAFSQQLPLYSQYMFNKVLLNPAVTGSHEEIPIRLTARQQWVGFDKAPSTQIISGHMLLNNETMGVGAIVFSDRLGHESHIGIQGNYAYILPLSRKGPKFAFGLAFKVFQYQLDYTGFVPTDNNDPTLNYSNENTWLPESDFGLYLYDENYYAGISANQMIELPVKIGGEEVELNTMERHYNFFGGYKFEINREFDIEPSALIKGTAKTPFQLDVNMKGIYQEDYWAGLSYRTSGDIIAMFGLSFNEFVFGFAYDYSTSRMSHYQNGTFELMLGYDIPANKLKGKSFL
ncbi:MAG: type IX secretion system membrane protein PorP/SprF [Bacteroidota bacterium]|nr:type IX secretion system membrane protein PorP/SprF [Bacteroidota bacterium]